MQLESVYQAELHETDTFYAREVAPVVKSFIQG